MLLLLVAVGEFFLVSGSAHCASVVPVSTSSRVRLQCPKDLNHVRYECGLCCPKRVEARLQVMCKRASSAFYGLLFRACFCGVYEKVLTHEKRSGKKSVDTPTDRFTDGNGSPQIQDRMATQKRQEVREERGDG